MFKQTKLPSLSLWVCSLLLCILFVGGCTTNSGGEKEYLVGIYSPGGATNYSLLREAGFSHIMGGASINNLDAAQSAGLQVISSPGQSAHSHWDKERVWKTVRIADKHSALYAWYLIDEPDMSKTDPLYVCQLHQYLKAKGVKKPTALVNFKGYESMDYAQIPDIMMLDRYPIGWQPIETFGKHLRLAKYAAGPDKPLIAVIQTFDWSYYPSVFEKQQTETRPPTLEELRNMTWSSLALGATGIFYYCYSDGSWKMQEHPVQWDALKEVVSEIRIFEPLFSAESAWWPKEIYYLDPKQGFNAVQEPSILSAKLLVRDGNDAVPAGEYLLCINTTEQNIPFELSLPGIQNGRVFVRNVPEVACKVSELKEGKLVEELAPFQIRIYGPLVLY